MTRSKSRSGWESLRISMIRKKYQHQIEDSEYRLSLAVEASGLGIWEYHIEEKRFELSDQALKILGITRESFIKDFKSVLTDLIHPRDTTRVKETYKEALNKRTDLTIEHRVIRQTDKSERWVSARAQVHFNPVTRAPFRLNGTIVDITHQKRIEVELRSALRDRDRSVKTLDTINRIGQSLTSQLELDKLVQSITDAATRLTHAKFGAFVYNVISDEGKQSSLYTLSGASKDSSPQNVQVQNEVLKTTFHAKKTIRSNDLTVDPEFEKSLPFHGMPFENFPIRRLFSRVGDFKAGRSFGGFIFGPSRCRNFPT